MKNIERGSVKYLIVQIICVSIAGMIIYPLFDLLFGKFIFNVEFSYTIKDHIIEPIIFAIVFSVTIWLVDRRKK